MLTTLFYVNFDGDDYPFKPVGPQEYPEELKPCADTRVKEQLHKIIFLKIQYQYISLVSSGQPM